VVYFASLEEQRGALMENQPDDEDNAPLANPEQGDVPAEAGVEPGATSEVILSTRTSRAWIRLLPVLIVLVVILVFVFQNPKDVKVSLFTFSGTLPLSVALLGAVILGALMALALGSVRIFQLRKQFHRKKEGSEGDNRRLR
jgi:putative membrane protein